MTSKKSKDIYRALKPIIPIVAVIIGIFLLIVPQLPRKKSATDNKTRLERYVESTESRLESTLSKIEGAGKTKVFITVSDTFETVYASNASIDEGASGKSTEKQLAYPKSGSGSGDPVVVKELVPDIKGVLIVCEGGNRPDVRVEITSSASTALGISTNKIYVTGGTTK